MRQRFDGSIQSSNTPTYDKTGIGREDYALYRCMVTKVLYTDDPSNITKNASNPEVLYECVILGGHVAGNTLSFCRLASWLGGNDNYDERILTPTSKDISKVKLSQHDGDIVWVEFVQGHDSYPTIVALGKGLANKVGAKKADGPRWIREYNGLIQNINNKGEFLTTMKTGKVTDQRFKSEASFMVKEEWLSTEQILTTFKSGLKILQDGKNDKFNVTTAGGVTADVDGKGKKVSIKVGSVEATMDGNGNKVSIKAGSAEVLIDGGSGKISLKGEMIDLGSSVSDFVTMFTQLASAFATHTHIGNLGAPTSPPMAPLLSSVGSQTVKVQP